MRVFDGSENPDRPWEAAKKRSWISTSIVNAHHPDTFVDIGGDGNDVPGFAGVVLASSDMIRKRIKCYMWRDSSSILREEGCEEKACGGDVKDHCFSPPDRLMQMMQLQDEFYTHDKVDQTKEAN